MTRNAINLNSNSKNAIENNQNSTGIVVKQPILALSQGPVKKINSKILVLDLPDLVS